VREGREFASTIGAAMMPRRLPLSPDTFSFDAALPPAPPAAVGWMRKAMAMAMHVACLALFGLMVVWPLASPIASGELAREFKPVLDALAACGPWTGSSPDR